MTQVAVQQQLLRLVRLPLLLLLLLPPVLLLLLAAVPAPWAEESVGLTITNTYNNLSDIIKQDAIRNDKQINI